VGVFNQGIGPFICASSQKNKLVFNFPTQWDKKGKPTKEKVDV
jgi:hypothetical protein